MNIFVPSKEKWSDIEIYISAIVSKIPYTDMSVQFVTAITDRRDLPVSYLPANMRDVSDENPTYVVHTKMYYDLVEKGIKADTINVFVESSLQVDDWLKSKAAEDSMFRLMLDGNMNDPTIDKAALTKAANELTTKLLDICASKTDDSDGIKRLMAMVITGKI